MASTAELLQGLTDLRLPDPGVGELALALGGGLMIAAGLGMLVRLFRHRARGITMSDRIAWTRSLDAPDRAIALASLLRELTNRANPGPQPWTERAAKAFVLDAATCSALAEGLYRPGPPLDPGPLEDIVRRASRRVGA